MKNLATILIITACCGIFAAAESKPAPTSKPPLQVATTVASVPVAAPAAQPSPDCTCTDCKCVGCVCEPAQQPKEPAATLPTPTVAKKAAAGQWVLRTFTNYGRFGRARGTYQQWVWQGPQQATYQQPTTYYYRSSCGPGGCR